MTAPKNNSGATDGAGSVLSTVAGPSTSKSPSTLGSSEPVPERLLEKTTAEKQLAADMPFNPNKPDEYGDASRTPPEGDHHQPATPAATGSTSTEIIMSDKVGSGQPPLGQNPTVAPLDRVRVDPSDRHLTTNQGVPVADNQHSLKIGLRGPTAMEDFILREKITHFDHERIPERVVHARGSAAHGFFESYGDYSDLTRAIPFAAKGKRTPVFVRFSTVAGERGSTDTARDVRGFAVKFYTEQGNWDLVGNNIPVFFIQDAMKFPDLVHAAKPEPHHAMPQAATAHDTFWDFASLSPEIAHMLMWVMSDRAIPRSYRTMQGFGVHTFRLINAAGESRFVKFHWTPLQGTHSLVWDEAVRISGADPDFHRRDLWEAIEAGNFPEWELGLQIFTEEQAASFPFDILDATKLIPEEMVPLTPVGRMVLDRNPDNFFAETEQVAFCTAHIVPGIDFSNDPLLQGRNHSYLDTQLSRLGGPNFHEIPINSPIVQIQNNQRDGMHRQAINRGRVNYEPNSLGGGCPFQAGKMGFTSFPERFTTEDKVRGNPELFAEHYGQARLFYQSQSAAEQAHIANAFRFELTRVQTPAVRERMLALLANVDAGLVAKVAEGLGMDVPAPLPLASKDPIPAYAPSPALSLLSRPGQTGIRTRRVAILVANGVDGEQVRKLYNSLLKDGAVPRLVGNMLGKVKTSAGDPLDIEISLEAGPSVMYDAVIVPDGEKSADLLARNAHTIDFLREQYRHCKTILALGGGAGLLVKAMLPPTLPDGSADPALMVDGSLDAFKEALASHRSFARETDPPMV
ncbi:MULTISPECIES: catalase [unclassified Massilia]|uniref:catalase n=1 Tax=unclassified Massilia TaxID=2609279 RepID=UPI001786D2CF|nr:MULTISPECIES: catalase [unclassified Massilia]MBD8529240.1 catalase [Massilia sp. CFBP 13647]MBD8672634.1 catalase [Massilia sp. CFBP 13721]